MEIAIAVSLLFKVYPGASAIELTLRVIVLLYKLYTMYELYNILLYLVL